MVDDEHGVFGGGEGKEKLDFLLQGAVPYLGPKDSDSFGPLPQSSLFRFVGEYLAIRLFCPRKATMLLSPTFYVGSTLPPPKDTVRCTLEAP